MACEVPVIASRVGGVPEVVRDGLDGYLAEPRDVETMAARAIELLSDAKKHQAMGQKARQNAQDNFCAHKIIAYYEAYYHKVIEQVKMASSAAG
jgi:glycosyltransferase involved in cell wall biosynthesis